MYTNTHSKYIREVEMLLALLGVGAGVGAGL